MLAAERARRVYARPEAIALYWQALDLLDRLPRTEERGRLHINAVLGLVPTPGWERSETSRMEGFRQIDRAIGTAAQMGDAFLLLRLEVRKARLARKPELLEQALASAEGLGIPWRLLSPTHSTLTCLASSGSTNER